MPIDLKHDGSYIAGLILALFLWAIPNYLGAGDAGPESLIPMVFTLGLTFVFHFLVQLIVYVEGGYKYSMWLKAVGPLGSCALNYWRDGNN